MDRKIKTFTCEMPDHKEIINVKNLSKFYGKTKGIEDVSFSMYKGEVFGFLGPNGAGKTTTIRLLLDLLKPTSGEISIFNLPLQVNSQEIRIHCGYMPGIFKGYDYLSALEYLTFCAKIRDVSLKNFDLLLEKFQLNHHSLSQPIKHLSLGNLQKLGIIQTFFHQPQLVILDEPTTGLDPLIQNVFYDFLAEYKHRGGSVFFSSHNLFEVERICDRFAIIREGNLVTIESIKDLYKDQFRKLTVIFKTPVDHIKLSDVELIKKKDLEYTFHFKGNSSKLLKELSHLPVQEFYFPKTDLEEVFMAYYNPENDD